MPWDKTLKGQNLLNVSTTHFVLVSLLKGCILIDLPCYCTFAYLFTHVKTVVATPSISAIYSIYLLGVFIERERALTDSIVNTTAIQEKKKGCQDLFNNELLNI